MAGRLLLVDDDDEFRDILVRRFTRRGMYVVGVGEPAEALNALAVQQFQAAVLDRSLPGIDGFELLKQFKSADAALPVIVLSGNADERAPELAREHGAFAYLAKPCGLAELEAVINAAIYGGRSALP